MKKITFKTFLLTGLMMFFTLVMYAQNPPPPPEDPSGNNTNAPVGGSTPVGSGLTILLLLGGAYGARKVYSMRKKLAE
jgi:hypothetical protein